MVAETVPSKADKRASTRSAVKIMRSTESGSRTRAAIEEACNADLMSGEMVHVSFRAPKALVEAAQNVSGVTKPTELGLLALAMVAQRDPTAEFLKRTHGILGPDHTLEY
jgi:hypothetical protein